MNEQKPMNDRPNTPAQSAFLKLFLEVRNVDEDNKLIYSLTAPMHTY